LSVDRKKRYEKQWRDHLWAGGDQRGTNLHDILSEIAVVSAGAL
jgi:hypothetical protein